MSIVILPDDVVKLPEEALSQFLEENRDGLSDDDFVKRYAEGLATSLISKPAIYRTFGAHWWPLKRILLARGLLPAQYGDSFDSEVDRLFSQSTDALTVCAAHLAQQDNVYGRMAGDMQFVYERTNGEAYEFILEDDALEQNIFAAKIAPALS